MTKYDLVLYGATGFTGKLVANYLASHLRISVKLDSDSIANWSRVPVRTEHLSERSDAGISLLIGVPSLGQLFSLFSH
jgi:hypothetical protein